MKPTHGRAKRGVKLFIETTGKRTKKVNTIAGYRNGEILAQTTYPWNTDTEWFCMWFEFALIPLLTKGSLRFLTVLEKNGETQNLYAH